MQFDNRITAAIIALAFLATAFTMIPSESDADQEITRDYGQFYSYTLQFVFDGAEAQTIDWDFGDGTEHSTEWNPRHVYADEGTYFVTQTTTNTQGTTTEVYKVQIMGFPRITFDSNGGSAVGDIQMDSYNATATKPADPTRPGYEFDGWFYESSFENAVDWSAGVTKSMTLYAKWTQVQAPVVKYTVTFDSNGGSSISSQTIESGQMATVPADPVRSGYTFKGWYLDGSLFSFATPITGNITLIASWTENSAPVINRTVSFNVDGGSASVPDMTAASGSQITLPEYTGTKTGYAFSGWSCNNVTYQPGQSFNVTSDVTFKAVWRSTAPVVSEVVVTFNVDGGSKTMAAVNIQSGTAFTFPTYDGTKDGCKFGGWACGLKVYQPGQSVQLTGDVTVKAIWNAAEDKDSDDPIDDVQDFLEKNYLLIIVLIIAAIIGCLYLRSRRVY